MIPVTPETVKATYIWLKAFPPFNRWKLLSAEKVVFVVDPLKSKLGDYDPNDPKKIRVSTVNVSTVLSLINVVAHEMAHMKQDVSGRWPAKDAHNAHFQKLTKQICKHLPFLDPANF